MPYKDRETHLAYMREYGLRRNRALGRVPIDSPEYREKISAAVKEHWKTRAPIEQDGEKNPNWRDDAGWSAIHKWLRRTYPKMNRCQECGKEGKTDYAFLRHPEPYTRVLGDYVELCRRCHVGHDRLGKPW